jgi:hypothetical protein
MLAAAYHRILPNDRWKLVERSSPTLDRCNDEDQTAADKDTDLSAYYATAMGGLS